MDVRIDEVGDRIYRMSTFLPQAAGGAGFTFNPFLIDGEEPLLFHCGASEDVSRHIGSREQDYSCRSVALAGIRPFRG
jgi:hypothetical protein